MKIENKQLFIEKWIDLNSLPRRGSLISWRDSVGCKMKFRYGNIYGEICIIGCRVEILPNKKHRTYLSIVIDKYIPAPIEVRSDTLFHCELHKFINNKIADVAPHLIQYLVNPDDAYKYTYSSNQYILTKCPICGHTEDKCISNLFQCGFFCPCCSDGVSMPNKLMSSVLKQCGANFIPEIGKRNGFNWIVNRYRYDFYFKSINGEDVLLEMDGSFHDLDKQKKIDKIKTQMAEQNNFKLIRIDCKYDGHPPFEYIKNNILSSELHDILPLHLVDWEVCREATKTSLMATTCELWEKNGLAIADIMKQLSISHSGVVTYLKRGKVLGLCPSYNMDEAKKRGHIYNQNPIMIIDTYNNTYVFSAADEAIKSFYALFSMSATASSLRTACRIKRKYKGLYVQYITNEQYKMIKNNQKIVL